MASRSPDQASLPRKWRISSCLRSRSKVLNPNSTASRFVVRPVARMASAIRPSSITILVRIMCILMQHRTHNEKMAFQQRKSATAHVAPAAACRSREGHSREEPALPLARAREGLLLRRPRHALLYLDFLNVPVQDQ